MIILNIVVKRRLKIFCFEYKKKKNFKFITLKKIYIKIFLTYKNKLA